jgi:hypothetical protein
MDCPDVPLAVLPVVVLETNAPNRVQAEATKMSTA